MTHIAVSDDNADQPNRGERNRLDTVFDIAHTDQSAAVRAARATQRLAALGEMTGGIVHDFRNLLAVIQSGLRLAEKSSEQPEKMRAYIAAAREGIDHGVKLTSQLLAFAKQKDLNAHAADVNALLRQLQWLLTCGAGPGVRIVLELASGIPKCLIDPSQFEAAILNLVVNARDAMPNGGEVRISTERWVVETATSGWPAPGPYVRVRVKDNGQGMPAEVVRQVFDRFFTTKGENGTGLGLPQVCAFMRLIGGHVSVASGPGVGTTFDLLFPLAGPDGIIGLPPPKAELEHEFVMVAGNYQPGAQPNEKVT